MASLSYVFPTPDDLEAGERQPEVGGDETERPTRRSVRLSVGATTSAGRGRTAGHRSALDSVSDLPSEVTEDATEHTKLLDPIAAPPLNPFEKSNKDDAPSKITDLNDLDSPLPPLNSLLPTDDDPFEDVAEEPADTRKRNRTLPVLAAVAVVSLVAGLGLGRFVVNPAEVAARTAPPAAGLITVPIERRALSNDVTLRGDVQFDGATGLTVETGDLTTRAVVTGQVPEVGAELSAGSVALEVAGRPVIVLPGGLPTFRTLRVGVSGPDVVQLKEALVGLGINVGDPSSDVFDEATAAAVAGLYAHVGYSAPAVPEAAATALTAATQRVTDAESDLQRAQRDLAAGNPGPSALDVASADAAVSSAERNWQQAANALTDLQNRCAQVEFDDEGQVIENVGCTTADFTRAQHAVDDATDALNLARAAREALNVAPDLTALQNAVTDAQQRVTDARTALTEAQRDALPHLPASEVVFLETLPRRVDSVAVERGETVGATPVMTVSGSELLVNATAAAADAELLTLGAQATIDAGGQSVEATITELEAPEEAGGRWTVVLTPRELTPEELTHFRGANVRVTIPVSATGGEVLTVPLAALTAGPGGEARIEVQDVDGETVLVEVTTGLAAGGHVEVQGIHRTLLPGELVVIGTGAASDAEAE